jgi:putative cardiolipin synthase
VRSIALFVLLVVAWLGNAAGRPAAAADLRQATSALAVLHPGQSGVVLLDTGIQALQQRDALIAVASRSIDAQYYIWNSDASGRYLAARLLAAAERGVRVRLLLDDINIAGRDAVFAGLAAHPNVQIRIYNPSAARQGVLRLLGFVRDFSQLNRRMHNKSFTADDAVTIVGGRNVGDEYFDLDPAMNFRDRELLAAGPVVAQVTAGFEAFWNSAWTQPVESLTRGARRVVPPDQAGAATREVAALGYLAPADMATEIQAKTLPAMLWAPARIVFDPPPTAEQIAASTEQQPVARELRNLVATARSEILVESAYFILAGPSLAEVARLHADGVRLRVLTNSLASNDLTTNHSGYARRRPAMLDAGIELHELRPDAAACRRLITVSRACEAGPAFSLHSKSLVVDRSVVYIGSFNVNLRSTYLNSETALIVSSPELAARVATSMEELLRPDSSWQVMRRPGGGLEWLTQIDGRSVRESHEPMTGTWRRITSRFYRLFPLEKYL